MKFINFLKVNKKLKNKKCCISDGEKDGLNKLTYKPYLIIRKNIELSD